MNDCFWKTIGIALIVLTCAMTEASEVIDFEDWPLEAESAWIGPVSEEAGFERPGLFGGTDRIGAIEVDGVQFINRNNLLFGNWSGFAISNRTDTTTPGAANQTSSFAGGGAGPGDDHYAVGFGYVDDLDPTQLEQLAELPFMELPPHTAVSSMLLTNTTYAALSMLHGDSFAKKFGGVDGQDEDYFRMSVYGVNEQGELLDDVVDLYLADYRSADSSEDFIVDTWVALDLSPLRAANRLYFNLDSTDSNVSGLITPAYFAVDDIILQRRLVGDFDDDGSISVGYANLLCTAIAAGAQQPEFDLDNDQTVSVSDLAIFLEAAQRLSGDTNLDGQVAFDDFLRLSARFGDHGTWSDGDSNCDGTVAFSDFLDLSGHFGATRSEVTFVPEPGGRSTCLLALGILLLRPIRE